MMTKQSGLVILSAVFILVLLASIAWSYQQSGVKAEQALQRLSVQKLAVAREALIDYSVNYPNHYSSTSAGPGHLPCPDTDGDGSPQLSCKGSLIGLMPVDFKAGGRKNISFYTGESQFSRPLWYVLSSSFRYSPAPSGRVDSSTIVNSSTRGELELDSEGELIALLIDPGPVLPGQSRDGGYRVSDYLEGENADGDLFFSASSGNDLILAVRWRDLMPLVERRVLSEVVSVIGDYKKQHGFMPWLAPTSSVLNDSGESVCEPCVWRGWLGSERYSNRGVWPPFSTQNCVNEDSAENQPVPSMPAWLVRNFWHRFVWLHLESDGREGRCDVKRPPSFDGRDVVAVAASISRNLDDPQHALGPQIRSAAPSLEHFVDSTQHLNGSGQYQTLPLSIDMNDQWVALP